MTPVLTGGLPAASNQTMNLAWAMILMLPLLIITSRHMHMYSLKTNKQKRSVIIVFALPKQVSHSLKHRDPKCD